MTCIECSEDFEPLPWEANVCPVCNPDTYAEYAGLWPPDELEGEYVAVPPRPRDKKEDRIDRARQEAHAAWLYRWC